MLQYYCRILPLGFCHATPTAHHYPDILGGRFRGTTPFNPKSMNTQKYLEMALIINILDTTKPFTLYLLYRTVHFSEHWLRLNKKTGTLAAVSLFPSRAYVVKVSMEMITGVVAQKYTHQASRYFLPFKLFNSAALKKCINLVN